jgi:hypothetical protein
MPKGVFGGDIAIRYYASVENKPGRESRLAYFLNNLFGLM